MSSSTQSLVASSSRPLRLRLRPDIEFTRQQYQGRDYWVAKDPISLKFYRFEEEEYVLLQLLNGESSAEQIKNEFESRFAPQKLAFGELFQYVGRLYRQSLLISVASRQGQELLHRGEENRKRMFRASMTNILAFRFKGFDPGRLLNHLNVWFGWFFSVPVLIFNLLLMFSAILLIFSQFETFQAKLPGMHSFFAANNWIWLGVVLACTKVIHELGHGLSCRRFGGQCHEMGVMLLVLMPCLYCNVSDTWMINDKWKRIAVAAAGMYVELVLASVATFVWWFSQPGLINNLALNVMFVSSVTTILFNANPLLRYDGYYILSDWLEVPNLRQKATNVLQRFFADICLGLPQVEDPFMPVRHRFWFAVYSICAALYKWVITFSIFWFLYQLLEPYGLKIVSQLLAMMALYGLIGMPLIQAYRFFNVPGRIEAVKPVRFGLTLCAVFAVIIGILLIPVPHRITCSFYVQTERANRAYVDLAGTLDEILVRQNEIVQQGQPLARLSNIEHRRTIVELEGEVARAENNYHHARRRANLDPNAANEVDSALALYRSLDSQLNQRRTDTEKLTVRAPATGIFIYGNFVSKPKEDTGNLPNWHGYALEPKNVGAYLDQGTLVGQVIDDTSRLEAILVLDQADAEFVLSGQKVDLWSRQHLTEFIHSEVKQISPSQTKAIPKSISVNHGGDIDAKTNSAGAEVPKNTAYQIQVPLENSGKLVMPGSTGVARIHVGTITIGQRLWRLALRTFRFDM